MKPRIQVADVFRAGEDRFLSRFGSSTSQGQHRVFRAVRDCRTATLGGHVSECDECGQRRIAYNSCRNRHCPRCQAMKRAEWTEAREAELLPVPYMHVVFTLPQELSPLALQNQRTVYKMLFQAAAQTLKQIASDPQHLGAEIGFLAVLHTWGQNLMYHPHLHCVVPAGGLSADGSKWVSCRRSRKTGDVFFLPVRILSRVFRGKFIELLKQAFTDEQLAFHGRIQHLSDATEFEKLLTAASRHDWVVHAKPPFGGPTQVLRYLARYTHRVAISGHRLLSVNSETVSFRWKDYADGNQNKVMTLAHTEFIRRFLLHVLPKGFTRIRYYGLLGNRYRKKKLEQCRFLIRISGATENTVQTPPTQAIVPEDPVCPHCKTGHMRIVERFDPPFATIRRPHFLCLNRTQAPAVRDTS